MSKERIDEIHIHNFKFFDEQEPIKLGGKHLLLYGENGSGKSSIYWALYTLFEASFKEGENIKKYFKHYSDSEESLVNIYSDKEVNDDGAEHYNSYVKVSTTSTPSKDYSISLLNTIINKDSTAQLISQASDFLNYKVLYKFQDFQNSERINLEDVFIKHILPYIKFREYELQTLKYGSKVLSNASDILKEIKKGVGYKAEKTPKDFQMHISQIDQDELNKLKRHFDNQMQDLIDFINANAPNILKDLGYSIEFKLKYELRNPEKPLALNSYTPFQVLLEVTSYNGKAVNMHRPQSFLNEAKITALAIAIRLAVLKRRINKEEPNLLKFIVFDDVMISLDMNNRDKLIEYLLNKDNKFTEDYQLLFLTHDKNLYDYVAFKIKKLNDPEQWVFKEMYAGKKEEKEYPIIIKSELEFVDKARKYYEAKDYTAASIFIRKEIEKIVNERLPNELKFKSDGNYLSLQTLWHSMLSRYSALNNSISKDIIDNFDETRLMVLNPQAHFQHISMPVYKNELDKAFTLIEDLKSYPVPTSKLLLTKGMHLKFTHPDFDYTFNFELLSDFYVDNLQGSDSVVYPKCKVLHWQYEAQDFYVAGQNKALNAEEITSCQNRADRLDKLVENLSKDTILNITKEVFIDNTEIENSIWTFKEIIDESGLEI